MNSFLRMQKSLDIKKECAFIPFFIIGYPNRTLFLQYIDIAINSGADALELGIPYSDPVADGPIIQGASSKLLKNNWSIKESLELIQYIKQKYSSIPIGVLAYANIVFSNPDFYNYLNYIDSILIPDSQYHNKELRKFTNKQVFIAPSNSPNLNEIFNHESPYVYVTSRSGVTGTGGKIDIKQAFNDIFQYKNEQKAYLGFGIMHPEQVYLASKCGFDGVIIGSYLVNLIDFETMKTFEKFISECKRMAVLGYKDRWLE